ncbi:MAG: hypothetical protein ACRD3M_03040 [Thermoanaerobaculia bacterium]
MSSSVPLDRPERRKPRAVPPSDGLLPIPPPLTQNLPRRFGDYLVTSELSRDALGRVFRAIDVSGNGEFVRLRIFDTRRVDAPMLIDAIEASEAMRPLLAGPFTARGEKAGAVDRLPYVVWRETHGWTLDVLVNGFRGFGWRLPVEHALLIADRIAAALVEAHRKFFEGRPIAHGLVWPGFVSVGADAAIFVAGFGLAPGIFPTLEEPTLAAGIAPYLAPEERLRPRLQPASDIYSVGAILLEMLTGRVPSPEVPVVTLRKEDGLPEDLVQLLRGALAKPSLRFSSMSAFRRELGRVIVAGRYAPSSFALSQLLSKRLGPQSIHHAEAAALAEEARRRTAPTRPRALPPGAPPPDHDAEVDSVLRNFWSRAETT